MNEGQINRVINEHQKRFNASPDVLSYAPGRVNLIGGHTDYNEGFVLPGAIDKGVYSAISLSTDNIIAIALDAGVEPFHFNFDRALTSEDPHWSRFVVGVVSVLQSKGFDLQPFHLTFGGDLPQGGGLSSSAALENSLVLGLNHLFQLGLSELDMVFIAQQAEHEYVGVKCGIMDQYASMFGESGKVIYLDCRSLDARPLSLPLEGYQLLLFNTNVKHQLADAAYNDRRNACLAVSQLAGVKSLRDMTLTALEALRPEMSYDKYEKAKYVIEEIQRTEAAILALYNSDILLFGKMMFEAHEGLSKKYKVSCDELDFLIDLASTHSDIIGARMMGGGFGGCTINIVKTEAVQRVEEEFSALYLEKFGIQCDIQRVTLSDGAQLVKRK